MGNGPCNSHQPLPRKVVTVARSSKSEPNTRNDGELLSAFADLGRIVPLPDNLFNVIHANQVIEHVPDVDLFASEIWRMLKPGGTAIVSTENTSSWHNVFAAICGWQMFSSTNLSELRLGIGNPLAVHLGETEHMKTWTHKVLFSARGLREFFEAHGFQVEAVKGSGYHPMPAWVGQWDVAHAHFITIIARKPTVVEEAKKVGTH